MGWGAAIGAAASLAGGLLSSKSNKDTNDANREQAALNYQQQKEFAQHGIRWKVKDARAAGLHPLAALGAQTSSFSPIAIGASPDPLGQSISAMGQDIGRAIDQTRTRAERQREVEDAIERRDRQAKRQENIDALTVERHRADLQHINLQNQLLASQIGRYKSAQLGPGMPANLGEGSSRGAVSGVSPTGAVSIQPAKITSADPSNPSLEAGVSPGFKQFRIGGREYGANVELPGQEMAESLDAAGPFVAPAYLMGHNLLRAGESLFKGPGTKGLPDLPSTHRWQWNPLRREYKAVRNSQPHNPWKRY